MNFLKLPKSVKRIRKGERTLIFNPTVPAWIVTNRNGELILNFCNGKRTPQEVIEAFGKKYGIEHKPIVEKFIFEAINSSVFDSEGLTTLCKISNYRLRILQLSLTSACNLKCIYCYATDREEKGKHKLIFNDYRKIIDDAVKLSSGLDIVLTGGEPLLNKNCFAIAEYAKSKGCNPQLLTRKLQIGMKNMLQKAHLSPILLSNK